MREIKHISWSNLNWFDLYKEQRYNNYVLWIKWETNKAMTFGSEYEEIMGQTLYKWMEQQIKIEEYIEGYKILWFVDFGDDDMWIECKTKSWWRTEKQIKESWQFRIYNHFRWKKMFYIHQYNKKQDKYRVESIGWDDTYFIPDIYSKIKEVERCLNENNVRLLKY